MSSFWIHVGGVLNPICPGHVLQRASWPGRGLGSQLHRGQPHPQICLHRQPETWACRRRSSHLGNMIGLINQPRLLPSTSGQVLVHSTVSWGLKHKQLSLPEAEKLLVAAVAELFPHWPKPKELKTLKWLYSQVGFSRVVSFTGYFLGSVKVTAVTHSGKGIWYRHLHDADDKASHQYVLTGPQKLPWLPGQCGGFSKASSSSRRRRFRSKQQLLWLSTVRPQSGWTPEKCILVEDRWDSINLVANVYQGKMNQGCLWAHSYMKMLKRVK